MKHCYKFAIVRFAPNNARDESLNIGAAVFSEHGVDVRLTKRLEKLRCISAALDLNTLRQLVENLRDLDYKALNAMDTISERVRKFGEQGSIRLSNIGTFVAESATTYELRIDSILKAMVDPEPSLKTQKVKRSRLISQMKSFFRQERVLARADEGLESHRILSSYAMDEGLIADFVLKNGSMHIVETIDAAGSENTLRKAIGDIGVASLVLERARMKFGDNKTNGLIVYSASAVLERVAAPALAAAAHQGARLVNWESADDRISFVHLLSSLATPYQKLKQKKVLGASLHFGS